MGWTTGSEIAQDLWNAIKDELNDKQKKKIKEAIIEVFEDFDCDTMYEVQW